MEKTKWKFKINFKSGLPVEYSLANNYTEEEAEIVFENLRIDFMRFVDDSDLDHGTHFIPTLNKAFACIPFENVNSFSIEKES